MTRSQIDLHLHSRMAMGDSRLVAAATAVGSAWAGAFFWWALQRKRCLALGWVGGLPIGAGVAFDVAPKKMPVYTQVSNAPTRIAEEVKCDAVLVLELLSRPVAEFLSFTEVWRSRSVARGWQPLSEARVACSRCAKGATAEQLFDSINYSSGGRRATITGHVVDIGGIIECVVARPELLDARDCANRTLLMKAVQLNALQITRALLVVGADPNARGGNGWTALHFSAVGRDADMCDLLLDHGARADQKSSNGNTPLFYSQTSGDERVVQRLLRRGVQQSSDTRAARAVHMMPKRKRTDSWSDKDSD